MTQRLRFSATPNTRLGVADSAYLEDTDDPLDSLVAQVIDAMDLSIDVRVGDVTAPLAYWRDPEHWADDWRQQEGPEFDPMGHLYTHLEEG